MVNEGMFWEEEREVAVLFYYVSSSLEGQQARQHEANARAQLTSKMTSIVTSLCSLPCALVVIITLKHLHGDRGCFCVTLLTYGVNVNRPLSLTCDKE